MQLLTPDQVASRLQIHTRSLSRWRTNGGGPPFLRVGGVIRYPSDSLEDWLQSRSARSVADYQAERKEEGPDA